MTLRIFSVLLMRLFVLCLTFFSAISPAPAICEVLPGSKHDIDTVQADVRDLIKAVYSGDVSTILDHTHPLVIEQLGGPEKTADNLKASYQKIKENAPKVDQLNFPQDPVFLKGDQHEFAVIPVELTVNVKGDRITSNTYQLGVREANKEKWRYIEGTRITKSNLYEMFPDFPQDFKFEANPKSTKSAIQQRNTKQKNGPPNNNAEKLLEYITMVRQSIHKNWRKDPAWSEKSPPLSAVLLIEIAKDGKLKIGKIERASGDNDFDASVRSAIADSDPLPPPPSEEIAAQVRTTRLYFDARD